MRKLTEWLVVVLVAVVVVSFGFVNVVGFAYAQAPPGEKKDDMKDMKKGEMKKGDAKDVKKGDMKKGDAKDVKKGEMKKGDAKDMKKAEMKKGEMKKDEMKKDDTKKGAKMEEKPADKK
jgi:hypothetical protein